MVMPIAFLPIPKSMCKGAIPPLAIPGCGCAPSGIPGAVTSVTVVTLVPFSLHSHYVGIRTIYIGPVYSCVISLITPPPPPLLTVCITLY